MRLPSFSTLLAFAISGPLIHHVFSMPIPMCSIEGCTPSRNHLAKRETTTPTVRLWRRSGEEDAVAKLDAKIKAEKRERQPRIQKLFKPLRLTRAEPQYRASTDTSTEDRTPEDKAIWRGSAWKKLVGGSSSQPPQGPIERNKGEGSSGKTKKPRPKAIGPDGRVEGPRPHIPQLELYQKEGEPTLPPTAFPMSPGHQEGGTGTPSNHGPLPPVWKGKGKQRQVPEEQASLPLAMYRKKTGAKPTLDGHGFPISAPQSQFTGGSAAGDFGHGALPLGAHQDGIMGQGITDSPVSVDFSRLPSPPLGTT